MKVTYCNICREYKEIVSYSEIIDFALCDHCNRMPFSLVNRMIRRLEGI